MLGFVKKCTKAQFEDSPGRYDKCQSVSGDHFVANNLYYEQCRRNHVEEEIKNIYRATAYAECRELIAKLGLRRNPSRFSMLVDSADRDSAQSG